MFIFHNIAYQMSAGQPCLWEKDLPFLRVCSWAGVPIPCLGLSRKHGRGSEIKAIKWNISRKYSHQHCFWEWATLNSHSDVRTNLTRWVKWVAWNEKLLPLMQRALQEEKILQESDTCRIQIGLLQLWLSSCCVRVFLRTGLKKRAHGGAVPLG